ncbi:MAG: C13 family peptidase [Pseudomonadota bacterium]
MQLFLLVIFPFAVQTLLARLEIPGTAVFNRPAWAYPLFGTMSLVFLIWAFLVPNSSPQKHPGPVAAWLGLWTVAALPIGLVATMLIALTARGVFPAWWSDSSWFGWIFYGAFWAWTSVVVWRVTACFTRSSNIAFGLVLGAMLLQGLGTWQFSSRPWRMDYSEQVGNRHESLTLTQEVFEDQQTLLSKALDGLAPRLAGRVNVYAIVFAPYSQEVFLRESTMVANTLEDRFGAKDHVVQLVNRPAATTSIAWATNKNLKASIEAAARRMDVQEDVLVIYLTSHGGSDFRLATSHWPLEVDELTPALLRKMLDDAGVQNRVIAISACYSGGWVAPLASDTSLIMTASDASHTSYGCGAKSRLTYFGQSIFEEQLRKTYSFEDAFAAAVPIIKQRELDAKKTDGFSNPQIAVGRDIRPVLKRLEQERGRMP